MARSVHFCHYQNTEPSWCSEVGSGIEDTVLFCNISFWFSMIHMMMEIRLVFWFPDLCPVLLAPVTGDSAAVPQNVCLENESSIPASQIVSTRGAVAPPSPPRCSMACSSGISCAQGPPQMVVSEMFFGETFALFPKCGFWLPLNFGSRII